MPESKEMEGVRDQIIGTFNETKADWEKRFDALVAQGANTEEVREMVERAMKRLEETDAAIGRMGHRHQEHEQKSLGEYVGENFKDTLDELNAKVSRTGLTRGTLGQFPIKSFFLNPEFSAEIKTTITSSTVGSSTPGILVSQRVPGIVSPGIRRIRVRDLIERFPTSSNAVEFVKENVYTNAASPSNEGSAAPESALTFTIDYENVRRLTHFVPASRIVLDDFVQLQNYLNGRLFDGLRDVEDNQILSGDGTGANLSGISTEADAYGTTRTQSGDTRIDILNHCIAQLEEDNMTPTGIIMNPQDWRNIEVIKTDEGTSTNKGAYLMGGPRGQSDPFVWGLPVATSNGVGVGTFFVGAFKGYVELYDRMDAVVTISTEYDDYFVKGMVAVMAEERVALITKRADAVIYGSF